MITLTPCEPLQIMADFTLTMCLDPADPDMLDITGVLKRDTYMGFSFGAVGMDAGTDIISFNPNTFTVSDKVSIDYQAPVADASQDLTDTGSGADSDGTVTLSVKRELDTGDDDDYVVQLDKAFYLGWVAND